MVTRQRIRRLSLVYVFFSFFVNSEWDEGGVSEYVVAAMIWEKEGGGRSM
jgi:hypothetical protein